MVKCKVQQHPRARVCAGLPSHRKPTSPQMKSLQAWQKVGLVRVTFFRLCPSSWLLARPLPAAGLAVRLLEASRSGVFRTDSAMSPHTGSLGRAPLGSCRSKRKSSEPEIPPAPKANYPDPKMWPSG